MRQSFLKIIIILIVLSSSALSLCMKRAHDNDVLDVVNNNNHFMYLADKYFNQSMPQSALLCDSLHERTEKKLINRAAVDLLQEKRLELFRALPSEVAQQKIDAQFSAMKQRLKDDENMALDNLREMLHKDYDIDKKLIPSYAILKKYNEFYLTQELADVKCDEQLPVLWVQSLKAAMKCNGIVPQSVNIVFSQKNSNDVAYGNGSFVSHCFGPSYNTPGSIALNKKYCKSDHSEHEKMELIHTAYHEVQHLAQGHALMNDVISTAMRKNSLDVITKRERIKKMQSSSAYRSFILSIERSADVLSALEDYRLAYCGVNLNTYAGSDNYLLTAFTNWQVLKEIENREQVQTS